MYKIVLYYIDNPNDALIIKALKKLLQNKGAIFIKIPDEENYWHPGHFPFREENSKYFENCKIAVLDSRIQQGDRNLAHTVALTAKQLNKETAVFGILEKRPVSTSSFNALVVTQLPFIKNTFFIFETIFNWLYKPEKDVPIMVHALYAGCPLCVFSDQLFPKDWPTNNKWVSTHDVKDINCVECKEKAIEYNKTHEQ